MNSKSSKFGSALYQRIITTVDPHVPNNLRSFWESPTGPKTIFFWAPMMKWALVFAGISDSIYRPVDKISPYQTASLAVSGMIWTRYSMVIIPKNYSLMAVNMLVSVTNLMQLCRFGVYRFNNNNNVN